MDALSMPEPIKLDPFHYLADLTIETIVLDSGASKVGSDQARVDNKFT
jgi:hypothetical protein